LLEKLHIYFVSGVSPTEHTVCLLAIAVRASQDAVGPFRLTTLGPWDNVVNAQFCGPWLSPAILALIAVPTVDGPTAEMHSLLWQLVIAAKQDNFRNTEVGLGTTECQFAFRWD